MSFSASPLVPGQSNGVDDGWPVAAELVARAVGEALAQIPSPVQLQAGTPVPADLSQLPAGVSTAVTGFLSGAREGSLLIVVGQDLQAALAGTPFGDVEPAQALRPALETVADTLGGRIDGAPTAIPAEGCLDVLAGAVSVLVPLTADGIVVSAIGVSFTQPPVAASGLRPGAASAASAMAAGRWGIDMLRDVEMEVTCELGRTRMTVRQLLALAPGDVVELDRLAGAPADLLVNGTLLARGEVVVIDESFGLRITEIVTKDAT